MKQNKTFFRHNQQNLYLVLIILSAIAGLLFYRLGSITNGLSKIELINAYQSWQGLLNNPLYLPLNLLRAFVGSVSNSNSLTQIRLPNVILGIALIFSFSLLIKFWHGNRTAIFGTILFATSAWVLHITRIATYDVLYLLIIPTLLLSVVALQRYPKKISLYFASLTLWGLLLYIPGSVWIIGLAAYWQRRTIKHGWSMMRGASVRTVYVLTGLIWLPLLIYRLTNISNLKLWFGLPEHLARPSIILKQFLEVLTQLFIKGNNNPVIWMGRAPLLDIFTLSMVLLGIYFYSMHRRVGRSKVLLSFFLLGAVLISLGGPVTISLVVPIVYICAATGVALLIHQWLQVFPINPVARALGIGLVAVVISLSSLYNVRSYFVAWPHNTETQKTFVYHP
jgi:hypothetical protein